MTPFHSASKADFCVLKIPYVQVLKIFSKPCDRRVKVAKGIVIFRTLSLYQSRTNRFLHSVSVAVTIRGTRFEVSGQ